MDQSKITIIGGGNLGSSIGKGILSLGTLKKENLVICEKRKLRIKYLEDIGFKVIDSDLKASVANAGIIIISVKPQQFLKLLEEIKPYIAPGQIIISTVTGVTIAEMESILGKLPLVRIMPNTAIEIRQSMTCLCFSNTTAEHEDKVVKLFSKLGQTILLQEDLLDAVTVLGACGIAFALRFIRAATQGGIEIGFSAEVSQLIVSQTVKGAAGLLHENSTHPEAEIDKVTTPQGITISGLNEMEHQGFSSSVIKGLITSYNKLTLNNHRNND